MQLAQRVFSKPAKFAATFAVLVLLSGLLMDGEYKRLFMAGGSGLILFVGGVIAEWLRPTRRSADTK
jgi:hypothetical protein